MSIAIIFESMFGSTRQLAAAIAETLAGYGPVTVTTVNDPGSVQAARDAAVVVIGGPTHVQGMSRPATRAEAQKWTMDAARGLVLEPGAPGMGVREWIESLPAAPPLIVAFDSRADTARIFSGAASGRIEQALVKRGSRALVPAMSFLVSGRTVLQPGELDRARVWATSIGEALPVTV